MLLYRALATGAQIASWARDSSSSADWTSLAGNLKTAINNNLWDATTGYIPVPLTDLNYSLTSLSQGLQRQ